MPLIDKPLPELKNYPGRNPRPADFDAYWREAVAELDATDPKPELVPAKELASLHSEVLDLWFTGVGGARIYAKYVRPTKTVGKHPAVLQFHGYAGNSGDFLGRLAWSGEGFCVAALDSRGQGGRSEDVGGVKGTTYRGQIIRGLSDPDARKLYFRQVFLDTAQLARVVMSFSEVDSSRVGAMGVSQGGGLTLACAALEPRLKLAAVTYPFLCDYQRVWEMDLAKDSYEELRTWFRQFDPLHLRENEIFTKLGYIDCQHFASRIKAEVLMYVGMMDSKCPPSSQFAAYNKITTKKNLVIYPDYGHENLPGEADRTFNFMRGL